MDTNSLVAQFIDVTGSDDTTAKQMLEATEWQLEPAVSLYFASAQEGSAEAFNIPSGRESGHEAPPGAGATTSGEQDRALQQAREESDYVRPPLPAKEDVLYDDIYASRARQMQASAHRPAVVDAFRNFQEEGAHWARLNQAQGQGSAPPFGGAGGDPPGGHQTGLSAMYRPPFDIMFIGTFEEAKSEGINKGHWLLVNIQSSTEFASYTINRDVWGNEMMKDTVRNYFVFWQAYGDQEDGQKVCTYYKLHTLPAVLVIDPQTGQKMRSWEGALNSSAFLEDLLPYMDAGPLEGRQPTRPPLKKSREVEQRVSADAGKSSLVEDDDLQRALAASMAPPDAHSPLELPAATEEKASDQSARGHGSTDLEPLPDEPEPGAGATRVALRLPDGRRLQRRFLKADPVKYLRAFCCQSLEEAAMGRPFKLSLSFPGAPPVDLSSSASLDSLGFLNSQISMTWS